MSEEIEEELGLGNWTVRQEVLRPSREELNRIKRLSDENIEIIKRNKDTECEEEKRNVIVNLIGALDYYIHKVVLWGIIVITQDGFNKGKKYDKFMISINFLKNALEKHSNGEDILDKVELRKYIIEILKAPPHTYQKWENIREGLKIILPQKYETEIGKLTNGQNGNTAIFQSGNLDKLNEIRNNIVHHFDRNYIDQSKRNTFNRDIKKDIELIELIINSIHSIIEEYEEEEANK